MRSKRTQSLSADPFFERARCSPVDLSQNLKDLNDPNNGASHFSRHPRFPSTSPKEERGGSSREWFDDGGTRYWTFGVSFKLQTPIDRHNSGEEKSFTEDGTRPRMGISLREGIGHATLGYSTNQLRPLSFLRILNVFLGGNSTWVDFFKAELTFKSRRSV